ncbi:MAG: hypothetical protein ACD_41C00035G0006, partial [uncultured bacterium]
DSVDDIGLPELGAGRVNAAHAITATENFGGPTAVVISHNKTASGERSRGKRPSFTWNKPTSVASVSGYYVYFGRKRKDPLVAGDLQTSRQFRSRKKLKGNEKTYRLRIKAMDVDGNSSKLSEFLYVIDRKVQRPTWRSTAAIATGDVQLRWYKPKGEHVVGYKVYRATERTGKYQSLSGVITQKKYIDVTTQAGQTFFYKVRAIDDLGNISTLTGARRVSV